MTDRFHSLTVVLDHDIRDDDAEPILNSIRMVRGVLSVKGHVADLTSNMAENRAKDDLRQKFWDIVKVN